jgi:hypothetical protein
MRISQVFLDYDQDIAKKPLTVEVFLGYCLMNHPDPTVVKPNCHSPGQSLKRKIP